MKEMQYSKMLKGIIDMIQTYNGTRFKIISTLYRKNSKSSSTMYIKAKWERELNTEITRDEWLSICETQHTTTSSRTWREFGWKNLTCYFITPAIKGKQSGSQQSCWRMCGNREANHSHIFWECNKLDLFWENICVTIKDILGYSIPENQGM